MDDGVARVLPPLVLETLGRARVVLQEAVAVGVAVAVGPGDDAPDGGQEAVGELAVAGPEQVGGHAEQEVLASRPVLAAGALNNTRQHLGEWVRDPDEIKQGAKMPTPDLSADELAAVVAYLESLE